MPDPPGSIANTPRRKSFALTGRSVHLDPRTNAVRPDLADVRLADRVFAPHYAAPLAWRLTSAAALLTSPDDGERVELAAGERFEVLEFAGGKAWGVAADRGVVGYVDADALAAA